MFFVIDKTRDLPISALTADLAARIQSTIADSEIIEAKSLAEAKALFPEYFAKIRGEAASAIADKPKPFRDRKRLKRIEILKASLIAKADRLIKK